MVHWNRLLMKEGWDSLIDQKICHCHLDHKIGYESGRVFWEQWPWWPWWPCLGLNSTIYRSPLSSKCPLCPLPLAELSIFQHSSADHFLPTKDALLGRSWQHHPSYWCWSHKSINCHLSVLLSTPSGVNLVASFLLSCLSLGTTKGGECTWSAR